METIKSTTKRGQNFVNAYNRSDFYTLSQCYARPSVFKTRAEYFCRQQMDKEGGHGFRITSYNTCVFSCGWMTAAGLRIETAQSSYLVTF